MECKHPVNFNACTDCGRDLGPGICGFRMNGPVTELLCLACKASPLPPHRNLGFAIVELSPKGVG